MAPNERSDVESPETVDDCPANEFATVFPEPRRVVQLPGSPGMDGDHASMSSSPNTGTVDEACQELRELMGCGDKDTISSLGMRPLSSVSTSAGATPSPESRPVSQVSIVPPAPQSPGFDKNRDDDNDMSKVAHHKAPRHKVFVGGVPQDIDQDGLKKIFSEFAPVKKAWMQKHKGAVPNNMQKHRGFGFIIFQDVTAVDRLLGGKFSRFVPLPDGRRLEVKRAVSSTDMMRNDGFTDMGNGQMQPRQPGPQAPNPWTLGGSHPQQSHTPPPEHMWPTSQGPLSQDVPRRWATPDHTAAALAGTPPRASPMRQVTPAPPPPSPWQRNQAPTPPPTMGRPQTPGMMPDGQCMVPAMMSRPQTPGPHQASTGVLPAAGNMVPVQFNNSIPMRPPAGANCQPQMSATAPGQMPGPPGWQVQVPQAPWNTPTVCWGMELVPAQSGSASVPYPVAPNLPGGSVQSGSASYAVGPTLSGSSAQSGSASVPYPVAPTSVPYSVQSGSTSPPCPGGPPPGWAMQWDGQAMTAAAQSQQQQVSQQQQQIAQAHHQQQMAQVQQQHMVQAQQQHMVQAQQQQMSQSQQQQMVQAQQQQMAQAQQQMAQAQQQQMVQAHQQMAQSLQQQQHMPPVQQQPYPQ